MKVFVLGDRETVAMFSLAGIGGTVVESPDRAVEELKRVRRAKEYGLTIITEQVSVWAADWIAKVRFSKEHLLVIEVPGSVTPTDMGKNLVEYIREAVGIRI